MSLDNFTDYTIAKQVKNSLLKLFQLKSRRRNWKLFRG